MQSMSAPEVGRVVREQLLAVLSGNRGEISEALPSFQRSHDLGSEPALPALGFLHDLGVPRSKSHKAVFQAQKQHLLKALKQASAAQLQSILEQTFRFFVAEKHVQDIVLTTIELLPTVNSEYLACLADHYHLVEPNLTPKVQRLIWSHRPALVRPRVLELAQEFVESSTRGLYANHPATLEPRTARTANGVLRELVAVTAKDPVIQVAVRDTLSDLFRTTKDPRVASLRLLYILALKDDEFHKGLAADPSAPVFVAIEKYMSDVKAFQTKSNIVQLLSDLAAVAGADFQQAGTPAAAANGLMPGMKPTTPLSSGRPTADQRDLCGFNVLGTYNASAIEKRLTELGTTTLDLQLQHLEKVAKAESSKKRKASSAAREPMQQLQADKKQAIQRSVQNMVTAMTKFDTERCAKNWSLDPRGLPNYSLHVGPDTYCTLTTISQKQSKREYQSLDALYQDMMQMFANAELYHNAVPCDISAGVLQECQLFKDFAVKRFSRANKELKATLAKLEAEAKRQSASAVGATAGAGATDTSRASIRKQKLEKLTINAHVLALQPRRLLTPTEAPGDACKDIPCPPVRSLMVDLYKLDAALNVPNCFRWPVDVSTEQYYAKIAPDDAMDLSVVHGKLAFGLYKSLEDIRSDLTRMVSNAKTFNPKLKSGGGGKLDYWGAADMFEARMDAIVDACRTRLAATADATIAFASLYVRQNVAKKLALVIQRAVREQRCPSRDKILTLLARMLDIGAMAERISPTAPLPVFYELFSFPRGLQAASAELVELMLRVELRQKFSRLPADVQAQLADKVDTTLTVPPLLRAGLVLSPAVRHVFVILSSPILRSSVDTPTIATVVQAFSAVHLETDLKQTAPQRVEAETAAAAASPTTEAGFHAQLEQFGAACAKAYEGHEQVDYIALANMLYVLVRCPSWTNPPPPSAGSATTVAAAELAEASTRGPGGGNEQNGKMDVDEETPSDKPATESKFVCSATTPVKEFVFDGWLLPLLLRTPPGQVIFVFQFACNFLNQLRHLSRLNAAQTANYLRKLLHTLAENMPDPSVPDLPSLWEHPLFQRARQVADRLRVHVQAHFDATTELSLPEIPAGAMMPTPSPAAMTPDLTGGSGMTPYQNMTPGYTPYGGGMMSPQATPRTESPAQNLPSPPMAPQDPKRQKLN